MTPEALLSIGLAAEHGRPVTLNSDDAWHVYRVLSSACQFIEVLEEMDGINRLPDADDEREPGVTSGELYVDCARDLAETVRKAARYFKARHEAAEDRPASPADG